MVDHTNTYQSLTELTAAALRNSDSPAFHGAWSRSFNGAKSLKAAAAMAISGLPDVEHSVTEVVDSAIETIEREHEMDGFAPVWDTSGCEVDVGRYLSGEPENMIDYHVAPTTKAGRVIALCASVAYSASISAETIRKRGHGIAALAIALTRLGYGVEIWADFSGRGYDGDTGRIRTLVKGANDELDIPRIMYAFTHASMSRGLYFAVCGELPHTVSSMRSANGCPVNPAHDLPEGTIYLPCVCSAHDVPDAADLLRTHLEGLGLIAA